MDVSVWHTVLLGGTGGGAVQDSLTGQCLRNQLSRFSGDSLPLMGLKRPTAMKGGCWEGKGRKGEGT